MDYGDLLPNVREYVAERAYRHNLDPEDLYNQLIPVEIKVRNSSLLVEEFLRSREISHIYPQDTYPHLANDIDNVFLELESLNATRGAEIVTPLELEAAHLRNIESAHSLDFLSGEKFIEFFTARESIPAAGTTHNLSELVAAEESGLLMAEEPLLDITEIVAGESVLPYPVAAEVTDGESAITAVEIATEESALDAFSMESLMESNAAESALGSMGGLVFYIALKTLLSMEGARRRGEVGWMDIAKAIAENVQHAVPWSIGIGIGMGIVALCGGGWIIAIVGTAAGVIAPVSLLRTFWDGLNEIQKAELLAEAQVLGGNVGRWVQSL
jgi:hypothetical protein